MDSIERRMVDGGRSVKSGTSWVMVLVNAGAGEWWCWWCWWVVVLALEGGGAGAGGWCW